MSHSINVAGVDGCQNGWVAVLLSGGEGTIIHARTVHELMDQLDGTETILIDMPIGLPKNKEEAEYRPEKRARTFIPKKGASIFNAPSEQAAYCTNYTDANMTNRHILSKGLSMQSYYICDKIREVDTFIKEDPVHGNMLMESHPEVCFARLAPDKEPILNHKRTPTGKNKRLALLQTYAPDVVEGVKRELSSSAALQRIADDVIDATCLAIVALYGVESGFHTTPNEPRKNSHGIPMQMVYYDGLKRTL